MKVVFVVLVFLSFIGLPQPSFGRTYPWIDMGKDDIQVTDHAYVEAEFRLDLIRTAKDTIEVLTFDQRADEEVGLPLLYALSEAAERGVSIRFSSSWIAPLLKDRPQKAIQFLNTIQAKFPKSFKHIIVGGSHMRKRGWGWLDGSHEKLLIIDKKVALVTGRGHAGEYLRWLDTAFIFKGALVGQALEAFNEFWKVAREESDPSYSEDLTGNEPLSEDQPAQSESFSTGETLAPLEKSYPPSFTLTQDEEAELELLRNWVVLPASTRKDYQARTLHYNFLAQLRAQKKRPNQYSYEERYEILVDPVVDEVNHLLFDAKKAHFSSLAVILNQVSKQRLTSGLKNGLELTIATNGKEAQHLAGENMPLFCPGWFTSLRDLDDLMQEGAQAYELATQYKYLHRKLIIIDDTTFFGSHNFTLASSATEDEMSFQIKGAEFASKMLQITQKDIDNQAMKLIDAEVLHQERLTSPYKQWFSSFLEMLFIR